MGIKQTRTVAGPARLMLPNFVLASVTVCEVCLGWRYVWARKCLREKREEAYSVKLPQDAGVEQFWIFMIEGGLDGLK